MLLDSELISFADPLVVITDWVDSCLTFRLGLLPCVMLFVIKKLSWVCRSLNISEDNLRDDNVCEIKEDFSVFTLKLKVNNVKIYTMLVNIFLKICSKYWTDVSNKIYDNTLTHTSLKTDTVITINIIHDKDEIIVIINQYVINEINT